MLYITKLLSMKDFNYNIIFKCSFSMVRLLKWISVFFKKDSVLKKSLLIDYIDYEANNFVSQWNNLYCGIAYLACLSSDLGQGSLLPWNVSPKDHYVLFMFSNRSILVSMSSAYPQPNRVVAWHTNDIFCSNSQHVRECVKIFFNTLNFPNAIRVIKPVSSPWIGLLNGKVKNIQPLQSTH